MRPSDKDIVDVILGDAPDSVQEKVNESTAANPEVRARYEKWSRLITSRRESRSASTLHRDIIDSTLARLKESHQFGAEGLTSPAHTAPGWANLQTYRHPLLAMAAAGVFVLSVSMYLLSIGEVSRPGDGPSTEAARVIKLLEPVEAITWYVDFAAANSGDGTATSPFRSLRQAIERSPASALLKVAAGSTSETMRLDKRLRIEAVNGKVQIGAS